MAVRSVVADREADQRRLLRLALGRGGLFDVVADAADGPTAVAMVEEHEADLLVLDADLPRLDGVAVVERVRTIRPHCACVFVSSLPAAELQAAGSVGVVDRAVPATRLASEVQAVAAAVEAVDNVRDAAMTVGADKLAPRAARRFVDELLAEAGYDDVLDTVELLVTEVVTNAVLHARSEAKVVVRLLPDAVRVEVIDNDDSFPVRRKARTDQPGGRGLELVEQMSRAWGIDMLTVGKRTWFEVAREVTS
jgi:CheY-like chemotaxis protein